MKTFRNFTGILVLATSLLACGSNTKSNNASADSTSEKKKADTAIVGTGQKTVKDDSLSGDPSSKGSADPNAKLPKK